jgi:DNA-binding LacI/PurR family transcriptional regulator
VLARPVNRSDDTGPLAVRLPRLDTVTRVTLQTVADRVGVSRMTVSNAFSRPDQLSTALREKVLAAAAELGYVGPDPAARALARGTAGAIGVLMTDSLAYAFSDEVATGFLAAVADELAPTGLALTLLTSGERGEQVPARDVPMDGALVYSCGLDSGAVDWLTRRGLPVVFVDQVPVPGIPSVNVDDRGGARAAAQHLVDLGHRRIGIVNREHAGDDPSLVAATPSGELHVSHQRMLGWSDALDGAGLEPVLARESVRPADWSSGQAERPEDADARAVREMLERPDRPTAMLCFSDVMAYRVVRTAEELGLRVPEDLSVVGFDDNPLARRMRPALTTVRQDVRGKGRAATAELTAAIEAARSGTKPARAKRVLLPTELVVRDSTAPPAG